MQNGCRIFSAPTYPSSPLTGQKIPAFNETQKVHYRPLKSPPPVPVLHLINQTPHYTAFFNVHFNSILPSMPIILNGLFPAGCSTHSLSFCPSIDLFIPTHCRCRGSLLHFITHSLGLPWTRDRPAAEISTWQHTTLTTDRHPCPRRNSSPQSQQASSRRPSV
jgi:hypothetical protein